MKQVIGIFNEEFAPVAFVDPEGGKVGVEYVKTGKKKEIEEALRSISAVNEGILMRRFETVDEDNGYVDVAMSPVAPGNELYIFALADALRDSGFCTAVIYDDLRDTFLEVGDKKFELEDKNEVWAKLVNLDEASARSLASLSAKIMPIYKELAKLDKKWDDYMTKKKAEIKNRSK